MKYFNLHRGNINSLVDLVKEQLADNEREIQILYGNDEDGADDIMDWEDKDFDAYAASLCQVTTLLIAEFKKDDPVHFNVITNLLLNEKPTIIGDAEKFLLCKQCVCGACIPDEFLFKSVTNVKFIPPVKFCRRSFIEYNVARKFMEIITPTIDVPEIDYKEYLGLMFRMYGNDLGIGAEYFGI